MADRAPSRAPGGPGGGGISKLRGGGIPSSSVRRNLFQSQLTRRPTATISGKSSSTTTTSTSGETLRLDEDPESSAESCSDIVIRDKNGEIELTDPSTPPLDDPDEMLALDTQQESEKERQRLAEAVKQHQIDQNNVPAQPEGKSSYFSLPARTAAHPYFLFEDETGLNNRYSNTELVEAVKASLRAKVAALSEDNWMFEREEFPRHV
ncbi:hypothetical protein B0H63DRAFT_525765 [Podospora didyma]|uniref:Uncharacterized protein n=1 Tax=Podospora didyma TaxID=330526 RepID=A0AAE0KMD2_9PEZI|nr:hypothetical protein B0H63DRAFT_525765 [Podospora didyma]